MTSYDQVIFLNSCSHDHSDMIRPDEKSTRFVFNFNLQFGSNFYFFYKFYWIILRIHGLKAVSIHSLLQLLGHWMLQKPKRWGQHIVWPVFKNMFVAREIHAEHKDLIHDVSYDYHGRRMATCSSDQSVKASAWNINCIVCQNLVEQKLWDRA